jgi:hypothetical protein
MVSLRLLISLLSIAAASGSSAWLSFILLSDPNLDQHHQRSGRGD